MPNWCSTSLVIVGPKAETENLLFLLHKWTSKEYKKSQWGKKWLGNIVLGAGFKTAENGGFVCQGGIIEMSDTDKIISLGGGLYQIEIVYKSAWKPVIDIWRAVIKKYGPKCLLYWFAEEPGFELYETNDVTGLYFPNDFVVDFVLPNENPLAEVFEAGNLYTTDELQKELAKLYGDKPLDELIDIVSNLKFDNDDFFHVYPIKRIYQP